MHLYEFVIKSDHFQLQKAFHIITATIVSWANTTFHLYSGHNFLTDLFSSVQGLVYPVDKFQSDY